MSESERICQICREPMSNKDFNQGYWACKECRKKNEALLKLPKNQDNLNKRGSEP